MIQQAIGLIEKEQIAGRKVVLEVNLSGHSICDPELPDLIEAELTKAPIDPAQLVFEITETAAIANMDEARALATRIAAGAAASHSTTSAQASDPSTTSSTCRWTT